MRPILELRNLKMYYDTQAGQVKAADDVSFVLNEGESIGLVGESGCGKTLKSSLQGWRSDNRSHNDP